MNQKTSENVLENLNQLSETEKMSPSKLITFRGYENLTIQEAEKVIMEMEHFAKTIIRHIRFNQNE